MEYTIAVKAVVEAGAVKAGVVTASASVAGHIDSLVHCVALCHGRAYSSLGTSRISLKLGHTYSIDLRARNDRQSRHRLYFTVEAFSRSGRIFQHEMLNRVSLMSFNLICFEA